MSNNIKKIEESLKNKDHVRNETFENSLRDKVFGVYKIHKAEYIKQNGMECVKVYFTLANVDSKDLDESSREQLVKEVEAYSEQINMVDFENSEEVDYIQRIIKDDLHNKYSRTADDDALEFVSEEYKKFYGVSADDNNVKIKVGFINYSLKGVVDEESLKTFKK